MKIFLAFLIILAVIYRFSLADSTGDSMSNPTLNENLSERKTQILSEDDFITANEYGKYLYENPRGISCKSCHGEYGEGLLIAKYTSKDKEVRLLAPDITELDKETFSARVNRSRGVMPKYYLTEQEIHAIYSYIAKP